MKLDDHRDDDQRRDADRLELLDRLADRMPDLDLDQHEIEWKTLPTDGSEALLIDGGGIDGGSGYFIANAGDDLHVIGSLAPLAPAVGCVVIDPNGGRRLAEVLPDPLAEG
ncbi:MAG: hypothetical protein WBF18_00765 [Solirubrobacterales bacterium]